MDLLFFVRVNVFETLLGTFLRRFGAWLLLIFTPAIWFCTFDWGTISFLLFLDWWFWCRHRHSSNASRTCIFNYCLPWDFWLRILIIDCRDPRTRTDRSRTRWQIPVPGQIHHQTPNLRLKQSSLWKESFRYQKFRRILKSKNFDFDEYRWSRLIFMFQRYSDKTKITTARCR